MLLEPYCFVSKDAEESAYWWICVNTDNCLTANNGDVIAAPEYNWRYWYMHIPESDLLESPDLRAEWEAAKEAYVNRKTSNHTRDALRTHHGPNLADCGHSETFPMEGKYGHHRQ